MKHQKLRLLFHLIILISMQMLYLQPAAASPAYQQDCGSNPVDIMLVVDRSLSMSGDAIDDAKEAVKQFIDQIDLTKDQVGLVSFNSRAFLDHDLSQDGEAIKQTVDDLRASGNTDIAEAIELAHTTVLGPSHIPENRTVIILLSDGKSNERRATNAAQAAKDAGILLISIGLDDVDEDLLRAVATSLDDYYYAPTSEKLAEIYAAIAEKVTCPEPGPEDPIVLHFFLPIVTSSPPVMPPPPVLPPDLIVEQVVVSTTSIEVTIKNIGPGPVQAADEFWLDLYIDPDPAPTSLNQVWYDGRSDEGLVWGITASALPLLPGQTLTLTYGDGYYDTYYSRFSGQFNLGAVIYAQVDAVNTEDDTGGVLETHEIDGQPYNNLFGPVVVTTVSANRTDAPFVLDDDYGEDSSNLPARP